MEAQSVGGTFPESTRTDAVNTYVERGPAAYFAEFFGTFALVFAITAAVSVYVSAPTPANPNPYVHWEIIGFVHTFALFFLIQTLAVISGAHFNPAVTVGLASIRQIRVSDAAIYVVLQLAGGILGALLTKALLLDEGAGVNYGAPGVSPHLSHSIVPGAAGEFIGAFFLMWAIMGVAVHPAGLKDWSGLAIGATLGLMVLIFAPLTGASFNPARALGPALVGHAFDGVGHFVWPYVVAPIAGAVVSALMYTYLFTTPGKKGVQGMEPVG